MTHSCPTRPSSDLRDRLILGQRRAERLACPGVTHAFLDAINRGAERRRRLADAVLADKALRDRQAAAFRAKPGAVGNPHVGKAQPRVVGRHVEGPQIFRSEEHTSELQSLMRISYAVFCLKKTTQIRV